MCKLFDSYEESLHLGVCKLANLEKTALFSGKIYTADKNFTRPPVTTVATNFKSACHHFPSPTHQHHGHDHDRPHDQEERDTCSASDSFVWQLWEAGWRGLGLA